MSRRPRPDAARLVAFEVFRAVDERDAYANLILPPAIERSALDERDAAFVTELTFGALRWKGQNQAVASACVDRPWDQLDAPLRDLLILGVHQLHHMRVPTHAAVSATVELARSVVGESRAALVNAVLRKVSAKSHENWINDLCAAHPDRSEEIRYSHPQWIINAYTDALGSREEAHLALAANNEAPTVCLAVREGDREAWLSQGGIPGRWSPFAVYWRGPVRGLPGMGTPRLGVQDEGSQLVTLALTRVEVDQDHNWLDLCAGPGGKAALLSSIGGEKIELLANEVQEHRAALVAKIVGANTKVHVGDGREVTGQYSRTLIDAPCTGIGALRRRPESRWRRTPRDVARLVPLQRELLIAGIDATAPGGVIAYVTCSPHVAETRGVVEGVVNERSDLTVLNASDYLPGVDAAVGSYVQLWPHRHGTDAMFLALIRKNSR